MEKLEFTYKKDDNRKLFKSLEENQQTFGILEPQNYIPLYNQFFALTKTNYNSIMLNHHWKLYEILSQETNNTFKCHIKNEDTKELRKVFLKFSPLLDPIKYLLGKYDTTDTALLNLPDFESTNSNPKVRENGNSAYVDSFFTYLSSKLLHEHGFVHGLDFYGSFLALKTDFRINIIDDIEYLNESNFFRKNDKILYELEECLVDELNQDTRNYKKKLIIANDEGSGNVDCTYILHLSDLLNLAPINLAPINLAPINLDPINLDPINLDPIDLAPVDLADLVPLDLAKTNHNSSSSSRCTSCSSRTSNTSGENDSVRAEERCSESGSGEEGSDEEEESGEECGDEEDSGSDDWESESESDDEDMLMAKIKKFPVQVIALEQCEMTLDEFMSQGKITIEMWDSIVLQLLFTLITYQNAFGLTHNDLHTNNVMYIETDKKFFYYKFNHVYYKVPTFGKLWKIIDYGRAIYKFRGQLLCSDSYHPDGDAATQYNCEPYYNDKKPRLDPNFSFDLCRLGCALYDYLMEEPKAIIVQIMLDWVKDDKGRNILYKKNGDERYPDFKLYKMIARTVNKHIPATVLSNPYFDSFITPKKDVVKKKKEVMDLDAIPVYM
jgi:hypothetical protein